MPFISSLSNESQLLKFKFMLLSQLDTCSTKQLQFSMSIYLTGKQRWIRCCTAKTCEHRIMRLDVSDFHLKNTSQEFVDEDDVNRMYDITASAMKTAGKTRSSTAYLITDYVVPGFIKHELNASNQLDVIFLGVRQQQEKQAKQYFPRLKFRFLPTSSDFLKDDPSMYFCNSKDMIECPPKNSTAHSNSVPVNLRIFLGFGNITEERYFELLHNLHRFLNNKYMEDNTGKIEISGPRSLSLAICHWNSARRCTVGMKQRNYTDIYVNTDIISNSDLEFAPDVLNYLRDEDRYGTRLKQNFLLVVSDFISVGFLNNSFIFKEAMKKERFDMALAVMLQWNSLQKNTVLSYYDRIAQPDDLFPLDSFTELERVTRKLVNASKIDYSNHTHTTGTAISTQTTLSTSRSNLSTTTTFPMFTLQPASKHDGDVLVVFSLGSWTTEGDFASIRALLSNSFVKCVSAANKVGIASAGSVNQTVFCDRSDCVKRHISNITREALVSSTDDTIHTINEAIRVLTPFYSSNEDMPTLYLLTNFVSLPLLYYYDESSGKFRKRLACVDFQIVLANQTDLLRYKSSFPQKQVHQYRSFEELINTTKSFCPIANKIQPRVTFLDIVVVSLAIVVGTILLVLATIIYRGYRSKIGRQRKVRNLDRCETIESVYGRPSNDSTPSDSPLNVATLSNSTNDPWEMNLQQIIMGKEIGRGTSGVVYRGSILGRAPCEFVHRSSFFAYQYDNCAVAIKVQLNTTDDKGRRMLLHEIETMKALRPHENIANMIGCVTTFNPICLLLEFAGGGNLKQFMKDKIIQPPSIQSCADHPVDSVCYRDVLSFLWQICDGMAFVHDCGLIHRDLAARNVLLENGRNILISDFGLSVIKSEVKHNNQTKRVPLKWTAPEALSRGRFSEYSDVWSFGVCAWEILSSGADPFSHVETVEILSYISSGKRLDPPGNCDNRLWNILTTCWLDEPKRRPKFQQLKKSIAVLLEEATVCYGYIDLQAD